MNCNIVLQDTHQIQYGRNFDQIIEFQLDVSESFLYQMKLYLTLHKFLGLLCLNWEQDIDQNELFTPHTEPM